MKALTLLFAVVALLLATMTAQSNPQQSGNQNNQAQQQSTQGNNMGEHYKMSGKVSEDGKTVVNDKNNKSYTVSNPSSLKDYEGQDVALIVQVDPANNTIHIIQVAPPQP